MKKCSYDNHYRYIGGISYDPSKQGLLTSIDLTKLEIMVIRSIPYFYDYGSYLKVEYVLLTRNGQGGWKIVNGRDIGGLDLYHQPPANDRQRFVFLITPFGNLANASNWKFYYYYYVDIYQGYPMPRPVFPIDYPFDPVGGFIEGGSYIVYTFDVAKDSSMNNLLYIGLFWNPWNPTQAGAGYVFFDYIYKLVKILADKGTNYRFGYYPSIEAAHNYIMAMNNYDDGVKFPNIIRASGPIYYGRVDVPIFKN